MDGIHDIRLAPPGDRPEAMIVFFHGYGAGAQAIADYLGPQLRARLPSAVLRFPDGPLTTPWGGRSWFAVEDMLDRPDGNLAAPRAREATPRINAYLGRIMAEENLLPGRVIIAGFSQGASMAYFSALARDIPVGGVFSVSGGAIDQMAPRSKPPVMLLAGEREDSDYSGRQLAEKTYYQLRAQGFDSTLFLMPGVEHDIAPVAIEKLAGFTARVIPAPLPAGPRPF